MRHLHRLLRPPSLLLLALGAGLAAGCKPSGGGAGGPGGDLAVQVVVAEARIQPVTESLALVGSLVPDEAVEIKSEMDGTVQEIAFEEGQPVKQGDLLLRLDESKLQAGLAEAEAMFTLSQATLERLKTLQQSGSASQQEYDQAVSAYEMNRASLDLKKRQLKDARIHAPFDGIMGPRLVSPGQVISKNALLTSLVAVDPVKVEFDVPERFLSLTQVGQNLEVAVASWPGESFQGSVYFIAPQLDVATRTALVKARIPNPNHRLKPGMFANLDLTLKVREEAIVIPETAILMQEDRTSVFVVNDDFTVQPRAVTVGLRLPGLAEITAGLKGGEKVIVEGTQKVRPGGKVRLADPNAAAAQTAPPPHG